MRKFLPIIILSVAFLFSASPVSAYGGGAQLPPGLANNPNISYKLVCVVEAKQLPNNKQIGVPKCHIVKEVTPAKDDQKSLVQRLQNFVGRVIEGGN